MKSNAKAVMLLMTGTVALEDAQGIDPTNLGNHAGHALPWRNCVGSSWVNPFPSVAQTAFDLQGIGMVGAIGRAQDGFRDLADYMTFNQSGQGHLNDNGRCFVQQAYNSPIRNDLGEFG